ncbi:hypothetical protein BDV24DRAFT_170051 [Aspergillus arachidicola]|uniref:ATPase AAA-type core domain-containing protein n=1 Tax=Aspergillus arachidicola TaxID=656916 RepID=A0A5N6XNX9_9EURO|nr:hypothetical protein BDV24DRAFT_170051 [Aspergillus arachidicola]
MEPSKAEIIVLGRSQIDLITFKRGGKVYLQGLPAGSRLLSKFLEDENYVCRFYPTSNNDPKIEFLAMNAKNEVHRQHLIDTINTSPINIEIDKNDESNGSDDGGRRTSGHSDPPRASEKQQNNSAGDCGERMSGDGSVVLEDGGAHGKGKGESKYALVIDDPEGELLSGKEEPGLSCLGEFTPSAIFYQVKRPKNISLIAGELAPLLSTINNDNLKRFVIIIDVQELRNTGMQISRDSSWEEAAADTVRNFKPDDLLENVSKKLNIGKIAWIIRFSYQGAIVLGTVSNYLYFDPKAEERGIFRLRHAHPTALEAAFLSGLISDTMCHINNENHEWLTAIQKGLRYAHFLATNGFAPLTSEDCSMEYPKFKENEGVILQHAIIPKELSGWSILTNAEENGKVVRRKENDMFTLGKEIVNGKKGIDTLLSKAPIAKFGDVVTADRWEIKQFNQVSRGVEDYLTSTNKTPYSIGVFGAPGSGKSFMIKQIVKGITEKLTNGGSNKYPVLNYNLSQLLNYSDLLVNFQTIRDNTVSGRIPIVYFDEFDATLNGELGWLKFFLAPMQDGEFSEHGTSRPIGQAIFVFIGGTTSTFDEFQNDLVQIIPGAVDTVQVYLQHSPPSSTVTSPPPSLPYGEWRKELEVNRRKKAAKSVKKPDFISRLSAHLDIQGYDKPSGDDHSYMIKRAILLRSILERETKPEPPLKMDDLVLKGLLKVGAFENGARSIEHMLKRFRRAEGRISPSPLPPDDFLKVHVNEVEFKNLINSKPGDQN